MYNLNSEKTKVICEWFHKAYPNYFDNHDLKEEEILLFQDLEQSIINSEHDKFFHKSDGLKKTDLLLD